MLSKMVEVSDQVNWAKLMVSQFDNDELAYKSRVDTEAKSLLEAVAARRKEYWGEAQQKRLVVDLQTDEGAWFLPHPERDPKVDLDRHQIWVCPLFYPFLQWLYRTNPVHVSGIPDVVELDPDDVIKFQGYRRPGPQFLGLGEARDKVVEAMKLASKHDLPQTAVQVLTFAQRVLPEPEWLVFSLFIRSHSETEMSRWLGAMLVDSGRFVTFMASPTQVGLVQR